jgi:hypothetical protein
VKALTMYAMEYQNLEKQNKKKERKGWHFIDNNTLL